MAVPLLADDLCALLAQVFTYRFISGCCGGLLCRAAPGRPTAERLYGMIVELAGELLQTGACAMSACATRLRRPFRRRPVLFSVLSIPYLVCIACAVDIGFCQEHGVYYRHPVYGWSPNIPTRLGASGRVGGCAFFSLFRSAHPRHSDHGGHAAWRVSPTT